MVWVAGRGEGEKEEILSLSCLRGTRGLGGVAGPWGWGWRGRGSRALREVCPIWKPQACSPAGGSRVQQPAGSAKATAGGSELGACLPTAPAAPAAPADPGTRNLLPLGTGTTLGALWLHCRVCRKQPGESLRRLCLWGFLLVLQA